jgi:alpha,alpha-trehalase
VNGDVQTVLECEPVFDYGRKFAEWRYTDKVYHQGVAAAGNCDVELTLTTDLRLG